MDGLHDALELGVHLLARPGHALGVLAHLQAGRRHAAGVRRLARREQHLGLEEGLDGFRSGRHVRAFAHEDDAMLDEVGGVLVVQLVLTRAGERAVQLVRNLPRIRALEELAGLRQLGKLAALDRLEVHDGLDQFLRVAFLHVERAGTVGKRHDLRAEAHELLGGERGDVAGTGNRADLAFERILVRREHVLGEIDVTIARGLGTDERAAERQALARQDARPLVRDALVLAEEITDFAPAHVHVAGRHVGVGADVVEELRHEALAEAHHFAVAAALAGRVGGLLGVEVRAALGAAHRQRGERVLEHLLEPEELENRKVDRRVETKPALVGSNRRVELHAVALVHAHLALVVNPRHAEDENPLRHHDALQNRRLLVLRIRLEDGIERREDFLDRLKEFGLVRILRANVGQDLINVFAAHCLFLV